MSRDVTFDHQHNHTTCNYTTAHGNNGARVWAQGMALRCFRLILFHNWSYVVGEEGRKGIFCPKKLYACNLLPPHFIKRKRFRYELGHWLSITCCHPNQTKPTTCKSLPGDSSLFWRRLYRFGTDPEATASKINCFLFSLERSFLQEVASVSWWSALLIPSQG